MKPFTESELKEHRRIEFDMRVPKDKKSKHSVVEIEGQMCVTCPISYMISYSSEDARHRWCHACKVFFTENE